MQNGTFDQGREAGMSDATNGVDRRHDFPLWGGINAPQFNQGYWEGYRAVKRATSQQPQSFNPNSGYARDWR